MKKLLLPLLILFSIGLHAQTSYTLSNGDGGTTSGSTDIRYACSSTVSGVKITLVAELNQGDNRVKFFVVKNGSSCSNNPNSPFSGNGFWRLYENGVQIYQSSTFSSGYYSPSRTTTMSHTSSYNYYQAVYYSYTSGQQWTVNTSIRVNAVVCNSVTSGGTASSITTNSFTANWNSVSGATQYEVAYTLFSNTNYSNATVVSTTSTSRNFTGLSAGTQYRFQVRSKCSNGIWGPWSPTLATPTTSTPQPDLTMGSNISFGTSSLFTGVSRTMTFSVRNTGTGSWSGSMYVALSNGNTLGIGSATINAGSTYNFSYTFTPSLSDIGTNITATAKYQTGGSGSGITVPNQTVPTINIYGLGISGNAVSPSTGTQNSTNFTFTATLNGVAPSPTLAPAVSIEFLAPDGLIYTTSNIPNTSGSTYSKTQTLIQSGTYQYRYIVYQSTRPNAATGWQSLVVSAQPTITIGSIPSTMIWNCAQNLTWTSSSGVGNISVELINASDNSIKAVLASNIANNGSFAWVVGKDKDNLTIQNFTSGTYKIKIHPTGTTGQGAISNSSFTITIPSISVYQPVASNYVKGANMNITWGTSSNQCGPLTIEYANASNTYLGDIVQETPNDGSHSWTIPPGLADGQYRIKIYMPVSSGPSPVVQYSAIFNVIAPSVTVSSPAAGSTYQTNTTLPINWAFTGYSGNTSIELTQGNSSTVAYRVIVDPTTNPTSFNWTIPTDIPAGPYRVKIYNTGLGSIVGYSGVFNITADPNCPTCLNPNLTTANFPRTGIEGLCASQYLCSLGIIQPQQNNPGVSPADEINRVDLAKLMLYALFDDGYAGTYHANPSVLTFPVDRYVTPFEDLNYSNTATNYDRPAKIMSYLFYANDARGRTPFKRSRNNFYPFESITRMDFLQVLLEAWNVAYDGGPAVPFTDDFTNVPVETMQYIKKAYALGIITFHAVTNNKFRPYDNITREEAFLILTRLRKHTTITKPAQSTFTGVNNNNYILERNITTDNVSLMRSMAEGNFVYSQGGFAIPDIGFPLSFGFSYNSFITQLPDIYRRIEPLGQGWTHNFNSYIIKTPASVIENSVVIGKARLLVANGDGTWHTFDNTNENNPVTSSIDNFNTLTKVNNTTYELKRPDMVVFRYESQGSADAGILRLKSITDRYGNQLNLVYKLGAAVPFSGYQYVLDYVQSKSGKRATFTYNERNQITEISFPGETVASPRKIKFAYENGWDDTNHNFLRRFYSPKFANQTTKAVVYEYGTGLKSKLLVSIKSPKGNTIKTEFDTNNKLSKIEANDGGSQNTATTTFNRAAVPGCPAKMTCVSSTNANGTTNYHIEENGNMKYIQTPTAIVNRPESVNPANPSDVNPSTPSFYEVNGNRAEYVYNAAGYVTNSKFKKATGSAFIEEAYTYQSLTNNLATYTDPNGHTTLYNWSTDGKFLNSIQTPFANNQYLNQNFTYYTATGQLQSIINHEGLTNTFYYDASGNLERSNFVPLNLNSTATYDYSGRIKTATNPKNQTSQVWFDANDNLVKERAPSPLNYETQYGFDDNDNLTTITNARGKITTLGYDNFDRNNLLSFEGLTQKYFYTTDGKLDKYEKSGFPTDNSRFYKYDYDAKGRLTANGYIKEILFNNTTQNLQSAKGGTDPAHMLKEFGYDDYNRMTSYKDHYNNVVGYDYDNNGNVLKITYPGTNKYVVYNYDWANRLSKVYWNGNSGLQTIAEYYYIGSRLDYVQYGNGVRTIYSYDNAGRLAGFSTKKNNGTGDTIAAYTFEFDNVGNHLTENITEPYDQPTLPAETIDYTYDNGNRILTMNNVAFTHDGDGNVKTKGSRSFTYDLEDNLTEIKENGATIAQYEYDALGNRRWAKRGSTETRYVLDLLGLADVLAETNTANAIQNYYIHGMGLVARVKADGTLHYYHGDYRGSVVAMTNASQAITHQYQYDDFGKLLNEIEADANPFKYVGLYGIMHEGPDLAYMRARYYDPETGRFNGADPIWSTNLYPYANNNGVMRFDPSGEIAPLIAAAGIAAGIGVTVGAISYAIDVATGYEDFSWKGLGSASVDGGAAALSPVVSLSMILLDGIKDGKSAEQIQQELFVDGIYSMLKVPKALRPYLKKAARSIMPRSVKFIKDGTRPYLNGAIGKSNNQKWENLNVFVSKSAESPIGVIGNTVSPRIFSNNNSGVGSSVEYCNPAQTSIRAVPGTSSVNQSTRIGTPNNYNFTRGYGGLF